jgi:hypothetical protein
MVASITRIHSPFSFLLNQVFICYSRSQIYELCHIFKISVSYLCVIILPCIPAPVIVSVDVRWQAIYAVLSTDLNCTGAVSGESLQRIKVVRKYRVMNRRQDRGFNTLLLIPCDRGGTLSADEL